MAKFVKFRERKWVNRKGWELTDISINPDHIQFVRKTDIVHIFEHDKMLTKECPCTILVMYNSTRINVLGSYDEIISKINGE